MFKPAYLMSVEELVTECVKLRYASDDDACNRRDECEMELFERDERYSD